MNTMRAKINLRTVFPGKYFHFGIAKYVLSFLSKLPKREIPNKFMLVINIDGIPLTKSSGSQFWRILCSVYGTDLVFVIGIYHGFKKPDSINDFLKDFIVEMIVLESEGLMFKNNVIPVFVHALICDSPARAFVTSVKGHNAYHDFHKCVTKGVYSFPVVGKQGGRVTFPGLNAVLRDDQSFRSRLLSDYHNLKVERSDIERLKMNFVKNMIKA
ncbi:Uncharacterized protein APZ42_013486 [Daphnia magna]|uniref:Uncharacterized protein n=1 Tax=Daphnia magna TaxID=35525 RepID=A0A162QU03_9CRUS|nr:Uncharacterized protein APZ42_013486 [Daphnia magna]